MCDAGNRRLRRLHRVLRGQPGARRRRRGRSRHRGRGPDAGPGRTRARVAAPAAESRIVAFYMGAIEGNARECLDKSQMYTQKLYDLVMSVVVYPEIIEGRIINEAAIEPAAYHCPPNLFR